MTTTETLSRETIDVEGLGPKERRYSQGVKVPLDDGRALLFISGQVPKDDAGRTVTPGDPETQARTVFDHMRRVVEAAGGSLDDVVSVRIYVRDVNEFPVISRVRDALFAGPSPPASEVVEVSGLCRDDYRVEVSGIAVVPAAR